jgi:glycosyltransferase involved in cell wall biosynthesis
LDGVGLVRLFYILAAVGAPVFSAALAVAFRRNAAQFRADPLKAARVHNAGTSDLAANRTHSDRPPVVWFEVEDFLRYFDHFRNPTGLQRVAFEIFVEAEKLYGASGQIRFCRLSIYSKHFIPIDFETVIAAYLNPPGVNAPWKSIGEPAQLLSKFSHTLSVVARHPGFFLGLLKTAAGDFVDLALRRRRFDRLVRPDDVVVSLGASWGFPRYMEHIAAAKRRYGIKFSVLISDLIPLEHEALVEQWHVVQFRKWIKEAISNSDVLLNVSKYSRDMLVKLAAEAGWPLPRVEVLDLGTGLSDRTIAQGRKITSLPQRFVLVVSTIEIRKNHRLLVRVWRRLIERHGADAVPVLIFAGQIGWMVENLLAELGACNYLDGKINLVHGLSDTELRQAYRSCLFTIFPSLCEGWGLPIAESLIQGKFCVASNRTSIPEVGGDFVDYFDPSDDEDALAKIERLLFDPAYLASREARVRDEYRPRSWADCVHGLIGQLNPLPAPAE